MSLKEIADNLRKIADEIEALEPRDLMQLPLPLGRVVSRGEVGGYSVERCPKCGKDWLTDFRAAHMFVCAKTNPINEPGIIDNG